MKVAELFTSIQGEGVWAGTLMNFIRLAGCPVGKYPKSGARHSICTAWDGGKFLCDTDYHSAMDKSIAELVEFCTLPRALLTGGEPLAYPGVYDLVHALLKAGKSVHIETSGTVSIADALKSTRFSQFVWVTCSPKSPFLAENGKWVNEFKLVVTSEFDSIVAHQTFGDGTDKPVYLQPVNAVYTINLGEVKRCLRVLEQYPNWRLSVQMHKALEMP